MRYELCVFIGRFQIFHNSHLDIVIQGLRYADRVLILIGSSNSSRSHRNPFTFEERQEMILNAIQEVGEDPKRIICLPIEDSVYNENKWMTDVRQAVFSIGANSVALIGHAKYHTSYYLNMFPEWASIDVPQSSYLASTRMRESYFSNIGHQWIRHADGDHGGNDRDKLIPVAVKSFLTQFLETDDYKTIRDEYDYISNYRAPFMRLPFEPTFNTADAVITQSGHILMVRRKNHPGKGLLALPGGFVKSTQTIRQAMLAELGEETKLTLMGGVDQTTIEASIVDYHEFDDPNRDPRARIITHAFHVALKNKRKLPKVEGSDDAIWAGWIALTELKRNEIFADHMDIIKWFLG